MEVLLPQNQETQLNELAAQTGRGTDELVQEAIAQLLVRNGRLIQQVQVGIDQIKRGEFINSSKKKKWTRALSR
jgi:predicted transcriptional regulator